jgi:hypothetical protein
MKILRYSKTSRPRWIMAGCFALVASLFATAQAAERRLTDADIARYLPRLKAEAAAFTKSVSETREASAAIASKMAEQEKLYDDIASGKTDVLTWLRAHTNQALVPAGAVYSAECSRAITMEGVPVTAIFGFNRESPYRDLLRRAAAGDQAAADEFFTRRGEEETGKRSAAAQATQDFVAGILSFYYDHGFVDAEVLDRPVIVNFLVAPDSSVSVTVWEQNAYSGLLPRNIIPECSALPTGPIIEIEFKGASAGEGAGLPAGGESASGAAAEKQDPDYEAVKEALFLAYTDAENPSAIEVEIPPDAPPEVKAKMAEIAAMFEVRKANMTLYKRHEAELAPILKAFLQTSSQE